MLTRFLERVLFGATAEERVEIMNRLIDQRVARALDHAFAALDEADAGDKVTGQHNTPRQDSNEPGKDGAAC